MASFKKSRPDPTNFSLIPESLWNLKQPITGLVLSRILSGVAWQDRTYSNIPARTLFIPAGSAWISMETIREDISSAIGQVLTRSKIVYAMKKLKEKRVLSSCMMEPSTKGKYGLLVTPIFPINTQSLIDPVIEYKIHAYGDVSAFKYGEVANANDYVAWKQKGPADILALMNSVAGRGSPEAIFRSVGLWRDRREVREIDKPVYLPWIVLDIDVPGHIPDAHESTLAILSDLEDAGFDFDRLFVSFSGSKGFHIAIATAQIGSPVFRDSDNARQCMVQFVKVLTDHKFDPSTLSPLQMLRLTGTRHQKTGLYKRTWVASRFVQLQLHQILDGSDKFQPWQYPDPTVGDVEEEAWAIFERVAKEQAQVAWKKILHIRAHPEKSVDYDVPGPGIIKLLQGVALGEDWGNKTGRDWAAFTLSCYCYKHPKQHGLIRRKLKLITDYDDSFNSILETIAEWNELNTPPLTNKELMKKVGSAQRYIDRRRENK